MRWTSCPNSGSAVSSLRSVWPVTHGSPVLQPGRLWECPSPAGCCIGWLDMPCSRFSRHVFGCLVSLLRHPLLTLLLFPTAIVVTLQSLHQSGPPPPSESCRGYFPQRGRRDTKHNSHALQQLPARANWTGRLEAGFCRGALNPLLQPRSIFTPARKYTYQGAGVGVWGNAVANMRSQHEYRKTLDYHRQRMRNILSLIA